MSNRLENNKVAARYARALFETTLAAGQVDAVARDLNEVNRMFTEVPALSQYLENPGFSVEDKVQFLEQQFSKSVSPWVSRLLKLLVENNRVSAFPALVQQFKERIDRHENTAQAEIVTAVELEDELRARVRKMLESTYGFNRVELQNRVDPGLLGGAIIKIQDQVIDGSYIGRLEELRKQISKL
jgi:F-type H+-transporting ATPase subunit delta